MWLVLGLVTAAAALAWLLRRTGGPAREPDEIDREALDEAEREVRDLGAMTAPDDADDQLPDWGPGAPRS